MPGGVVYLRSEQFKGILRLPGNPDVQDYVNQAIKEKLERDREKEKEEEGRE